MRKLSSLLFVTTLTGCLATGTVSDSVAHMEGVAVESGPHGAPIIKSFTTEVRSKESADLAFCIAKEVQDSGVTLKDSSGSFFGQYTGNYYRSESTTAIPGRNTLVYVSEDKNKIVANGAARYAGVMEVASIVRYQLVVTRTGGSSYLVFSPLEQAQIDTGVTGNTGFRPIGAWSSAAPEKAIKVLQEIANRIESCLE